MSPPMDQTLCFLLGYFVAFRMRYHSLIPFQQRDKPVPKRPSTQSNDMSGIPPQKHGGFT